MIWKLDSDQDRFVSKMANSHYKKTLVLKVLKSWGEYAKFLKFKRSLKDKAETFFRKRNLVQKFTLWQVALSDSLRENSILSQFTEVQEYGKKITVMRKWKEYLLSQTLKKAQFKTATRVHESKLLRVSFEVLSNYRVYSVNTKIQTEKCLSYRIYGLERKVFAGLK